MPANNPRPPRPVPWIRFDLDCRRRYQDRPARDRWVQQMRADNEADIARLEAELAAAGDVDAGPEAA